MKKELTDNIMQTVKELVGIVKDGKRRLHCLCHLKRGITEVFTVRNKTNIFEKKVVVIN